MKLPRCVCCNYPAVKKCVGRNKTLIAFVCLVITAGIKFVVEYRWHLLNISEIRCVNLVSEDDTA